MPKTGGKSGGKRKGSTPYLKPSKRSKPSAPPQGKAKGKPQQNGKGKNGAVPNDRIRSIDDSTTTSHVNGKGAQPNGKRKGKTDEPKKVKLRDQKTIPVPLSEFERVKKRRRADSDDEGSDMSGSDLEMDSDLLDGSGDEGDEDEDEDDIMDMDEDVEDGMDAAFLAGVDRDALSRSNKETERLHKLHKSQHPLEKQKRAKVRLPSPSGSAETMTDYDIDSDDDLSLGDDEDVELPSDYDLGSEDDLDEEDLDEDDDDDEEDEDEEDDSDSSDEDQVPVPRKRKGKEAEASYELSGRSKLSAKGRRAVNGDAADSDADSDAEEAEVGRLPIKLPSGAIQQVEGTTKIAVPATKKKVVRAPSPEEAEEEDGASEGEDSDDGRQMQRAATQKGRFGRMGVAEIVTMAGWKNAEKLQAAKEQIATLGAEILAGGELIDNGPLLTRLSTFALPSVPAPESQTPTPVPNSIRGLALLSALAVYKDLAPGYRIRQLTEKEEGEKVRDEVKRLREGEKMLVRSYKGYLKLMETEIKKKTPLASLSLKCMCELLSGLTHFNFSENIMGVLVGRIGRKSWDADSEMILQSFISIFRTDLTSLQSQTLVRLIARMTKERKFQIHPNVLSCFLHLRLKDELDQMRESKKVAKEQARRDAKEQLKRFKSDTRKKWATKKQKAKEKEMKEIDKEMKEAEAEVDKEERAQVQTETLKNLFVLYFSILKHQAKTPLLPAALEGITFFAHFINIEFFRDLLACLRRIIQETQETEPGEGDGDEDDDDNDGRPRAGELSESDKIRVRLLSIATAFELLSGQGEAINIDLSDFINVLYALLRPLSLDTGIQDPPPQSRFVTAPLAGGKADKNAIRPLHLGRPPPKQPNLASLPTSVLLMRCLHTIFFSRHTASPPWRSAAFIKRLLECALLFPPQLAKSVIEFVRTILGRDEKLEGMLDSEERMADGVYRADMDDPQLAHAFATSIYETQLLEKRYWVKDVRAEGKKLADGTKVNITR